METRRNTNVTGDRDFTIELSTQEKGLILGFDTVATVTIRDRDSVEKEELQALVDEVRNLPENWFVSGWEDFAQALETAEAVLQAESPAQSEIADAYFALVEARDLLMEREQYTQDDPFYLPDQTGTALTLEAEFAQLHNVERPSDGQWALQVAKADWASHGEYINCLNQEDTISFPYVARVAGTYTVTATYRSGDTRNKLAWSEPDGKIAAGEVVAGAGDAARETHTVTFTLEVTETGAGTLVFTGPDTKSPQLDKLEITLTAPATCTVTVNTQGQGTASADTAEAAPGDTVTLTAQAEEGWHFVRWESQEVTVENNAFTMPEKAVTVTAVFEQDHTHSYAEPTFTFSQDGKSATAVFACGCGDEQEVTAAVTSQVKTEATCTEMGVTTYTATVTFGGETYTAAKDVSDIPMTDHNTELTGKKEPTCTEPGYTGDWKCSDCGTVVEKGEEIPALGHNFVDGKCTRCGAEDPDYTEPTEPSEPTETYRTQRTHQADRTQRTHKADRPQRAYRAFG